MMRLITIKNNSGSCLELTSLKFHQRQLNIGKTHRLTEIQIDAINYQPTQDFIDCYSIVVKHLIIKSDNALVWQKCHPAPPFLEHLSFHLGNQSFFVRLFDINLELEEPDNQDGTFKAGKLFNGTACYIAVEKVDGEWVIAADGWGLFLHEDRAPDFPNDKPINPPTLITDEKIPLNDAEYHYKAVLGTMEMLSDKLPNARFHPPNYYRSSVPHLLMHQPDKPYQEAFVIFSYRSPEDVSKNDERKKNIEETKGRLMDFGFKTYVFDVVLFSEGEMGNKTDEMIPIHRGEVYISSYNKVEGLDLE